MNFDPRLKVGDTIKNHNVTEIFKCGNMGGMRKSNVNNALVLISDETKGIYSDLRVDNIIFYTGMGKKGEMHIDYAQNRTVNESKDNGINMFLFEVYKKGEYTFMGRVKLHDEPYQEIQLDVDGEPRKVWIFPLRLLDYKKSR